MKQEYQRRLHDATSSSNLKTMILISLLVHEKPDVILDQVANFRKFAPEANLIIHPARQLIEQHPRLPEVLHGVEGVWVNTEPLYTGLGMVLKCHVSNFINASKQGIPFSHVAFHASNDMFVRRGVEDYIRTHDYGFFRFDLHAQTLGFTHWTEGFLKDRAYQRIMRHIGSEPTRYVSQVEGTFYPREAFGMLAESYLKHAWHEIGWPVCYVHGTRRSLVRLGALLLRTSFRRKHFARFFYPREEFYPPNFFVTMCPNSAPPYCLMNWKNDLNVTISDIEQILDGTNPVDGYRQLFAVKRVDRNLNDPLRAYIRSLD